MDTHSTHERTIEKAESRRNAPGWCRLAGLVAGTMLAAGLVAWAGNVGVAEGMSPAAGSASLTVSGYRSNDHYAAPTTETTGGYHSNYNLDSRVWSVCRGAQYNLLAACVTAVGG